MASVLPKVSLYAVLSVICLLINISIFMSVLIDTGNEDTTGFLDGTQYSLSNKAPDYENATITDFAVATSGSFVPFYSLLTVATYLGDMPLALTVVLAIVVAIISAFQLFLLAIIIINMLPKVLGSGWDV